MNLHVIRPEMRLQSGAGPFNGLALTDAQIALFVNEVTAAKCSCFLAFGISENIDVSCGGSGPSRSKKKMYYYYLDYIIIIYYVLVSFTHYDKITFS